jgi:hypothetical protein
MQSAPALRRSKRTALTLSALISLFAGLAFVSALVAPSSEESQVASALGCRVHDQVLVLKLQPDGKVRWPDGSENTLEETKVLVPSWCTGRESPVLAILGNKDTPISQAHPLLAAAQDLGLRRAILAVYEGKAYQVVADSSGRSPK